MHFFGTIGSIMFLIGILAALVLGIQKVWAICNGIPMRRITDTTYFYISLTTIIIGVQLFVTGFLAEMVGRNSADRNHYLIEKENNFE